MHLRLPETMKRLWRYCLLLCVMSACCRCLSSSMHGGRSRPDSAAQQPSSTMHDIPLMPSQDVVNVSY
ncbi:hypothetical protein K503DRAFT_635586 [Rhizopogon vinicolor AM-OR11-026]|uniref:Uncharacterized protein n=1 Tax=Rhizopogon vinicolor AM-OR11-026 TaxID=1314800 RepID=A0A1B7MHQ1_9AGAM|nr:hypothetical protein K503DRAFT_635586 [Rhizopogon vinicolor AM-OR11-026]